MKKHPDYVMGYQAFMTGVGFNSHQSKMWQNGWKQAQDDQQENDWNAVIDREGGYGDGGF